MEESISYRRRCVRVTLLLRQSPISYRIWGVRAIDLIPSQRVEEDMSREAPADADIVSDEELTGLLAEAEGRTPEEIERGATEIEIAPPEEATVVDE